MPKYQIEANENLFHAWLKISNDIGALAGIIQNDMVINGKELFEWEESVSDKLGDFQELFVKTNELITSRPIASPDEPSVWIVLASTDFTVIRVKINEPMLQAEAVGRESCEAHNFNFHGVYSEDDIERAELELDIPF